MKYTNIQTSLNLQQTYSSSLCSHVNNIYSKLLELQKQIQHHCMYMNQGDTVQIEGPNFDPDIDGDSTPCIDEKPNKVTIQGHYQLFQKLLNQMKKIDIPLQ